MCQPGMYPILQSPVPTTSGFVPHRPISTFKPINPTMPLPVAVSSQQGSFNSLLDMGNSTQNGSHLQAAQYQVHRDHQLTRRTHQCRHSKVHLLIPSLSHKVNKYQTCNMLLASSNLHSHKLIPNHRMLHHCNLLHQLPNHFSSLFLHTSNSRHGYSHLCQAHMLCISSRVSHTLYKLGLAPKANPSGNQGNHHHLDNHLTPLCSLSFQLQRYIKIQCPTPRSLESQSQ